MAPKILLCAALLTPAGLAPMATAPKPTSPITVSATAPVQELCPSHWIWTTRDGICWYEFEHCPSGMLVTMEADCDAPEIGCPCDDPVASVEMPPVAGQPANVRASGARREFHGEQVAPNAFHGSQPGPPTLSDKCELVLDTAVRVNGRPYRILSIRKLDSGARYDVGYEMVGVNQETLTGYPEAQPRAVFGNDMQANVRLGDEVRVFHLKSIGKSAVKQIVRDAPLLPVPDNQVPPAVPAID